MAQRSSPLAPEENQDAFSYVYAIEVGLRELIIERVVAYNGQHTWIASLPPDLKEKVRAAREYQRKTNWILSMPHHPIYYLDFTDLKKVIESSTNWDAVFKHIFGRKDIVSSTLSEIEPIRNDLAHNRRISNPQLSILKGAFEKLANCVGWQEFVDLASRPSTATDIKARLAALIDELQGLLLRCEDCLPLEGHPVWDKLASSWWFDSNYLGLPIDDVARFYAVLHDYQLLPIGRGRGHEIEEWVRKSNLANLCEAAIAAVNRALAEGA